MEIGTGLFFLAIGIVVAGAFIGGGIEKLGENLRKGMSAIAVAVANEDTFDESED